MVSSATASTQAPTTRNFAAHTARRDRTAVRVARTIPCRYSCPHANTLTIASR